MEKYKGVLNTSYSKLLTKVINPSNAFEKYIPGLYIKHALADLFEQLLLFDKVSIEMSPFNIHTIGILIEHFGLEHIEKCILDGEIEFSFLGSVFTGLGKDGKGKYDERLLYGQPPVVAGFIQPEEIYKHIKEGFKYAPGYTSTEISRFMQNVKPFLVMTEDTNVESKLISTVIDAYTSNSLRTLDLPFTKHPTNLNYTERIKLGELSSDIIKTQFLFERGYTSYDSFKQLSISETATKKISDGLAISKSAESIMRLKKLPNFNGLFLNENLNFYDALEIRKLSTSKNFRSWLNSIADANDYENASYEYTEAIERDTGFFNTKKGKHLKNVILYTIGLGTGAWLSGLQGSLMGTLAAKGLDYTANQFLGSLSDSLTKGFKPSFFIDEVKYRIELFKEN